MSSFLTELGQDVWRATWQSGLFVAAVFAVCKIFRLLPAAARHWLWWLACLQFPLRLLFFSPVALPLLPAVADKSAVVEASALPEPGSVSRTLPAEFEGSPSGNPYSFVDSPRGARARRKSPARGKGLDFPSMGENAFGSTLSITANKQETPQQTEPVSSVTLLLFGWGAGVATVLVLAARRLIRTRQLLRNSRQIVGDVEILNRELSARLRVRPPALRESDLAPCPLLAGWLRPTIVLPPDFSRDRKRAELRMALAHELAHLKRGDLWLAGVPLLAQSLFFFHPLAWLAIRESAAACEEACDIEAMRLSGGSPSAYARLLLSSAQSKVPIAAMGAAFGFRLLQRRITMLNQSPVLARSGIRRAVTALIALGVVCSIPWTVTAQSPRKPTTASKITRKVATSHKRHAARHHAVRKAKKSSRYTVTFSNGAVIYSAPGGNFIAPPAPPTAAYPASPPRAPTILQFQSARSSTTSAVAPPAPAGVVYGISASGAPPSPPRTYKATILRNPPGKATTTVTWAPQARAGVVYGITASGAAPKAPSNGTPPAPPAVYGITFGGATTAPTVSRITPQPPTATPPLGLRSRTAPTEPPSSAYLIAPPATFIAPASSEMTLARSTGARRVSIDMHGTDIVTALRAAFKAAGIDYSIKSTVDHDLITCALKDVPFDVALHTILESARQELTYRVEGGVYMILPKNSSATAKGD